MSSILLFNRSDRIRLRFSGPKTLDTINGLVSNNLVPLKEGEGVYAGVFTAKSRILADVRVFMLEGGDILLDCPAAAGPGLTDFFKKYVNPRLSKFQDQTELTSDLGIFGEGAAKTVADLAKIDSEPLSQLSPYSHTTGEISGAQVMIVRTPELGMEGFDLIIPRDREKEVEELIISAGAIKSSDEKWRQMRIELGWPEWGIDMGESTLPQEANFDELKALSHNKGCYIGQETVARIHFRGRVNRFLRRLSFEIEGDQIPPRDAELVGEEEKVMGNITSSTILDDKRAVGIGMVRREVENGASLTARWEGGSCKTIVVGTAQGGIE